MTRNASARVIAIMIWVGQMVDGRRHLKISLPTSVKTKLVAKIKSLKSFKHILQILVCIFHRGKLAFNVNVEFRCVWRKISLLSLNSMLWLIIKLDTTIVFISFIIQCPYLISLYSKSFQAILYLVSFLEVQKYYSILTGR